MGKNAPNAPGRCPCGEPATVQTWESGLLLCPIHARAWLRSPEKAEAVDAIYKIEPARLECAVMGFCHRVEREAPFRRRVATAIHRLTLAIFGA